MVDKDNEKGDITDQLLDEAAELSKKEKKDKEKSQSPKPPQSPKEAKKSEEIASETPQNRFRRIIRDQGYNVGIENMTSVFFEGNTDSPGWLDDVLKLSHIPAKSREMIITAYYGKPIKELGITIEPGFINKKEEEKKAEDKKNPDDEFDILKISQDEMRESMKHEKTLLSLAQMRKMRKELEGDDKKQENQQQYQMRQVIRPMIRDGKIIYGKDGAIITETVVEPVALGQQGGSNNEIITMLAMKALAPQEAPKPAASDPSIVEYMKKIDQKIESMESARQIQAKEEEIKRLNDKIDREKDDSKKELERKQKEYDDRLDKLNEERIRDLNELKERFTETVQHKKELDDIVGQVTGSHKKEIDALKQKLEHSSTNIEKTIVSKSTDTVDKLTGKMGDIAESVIKPMAEVMKDHYKTVIDQTRQNSGLPPMKDSIPKVNESELEQFAKE